MNEAFREAASGKLRGILDATEEELVSSDFNGNSHSSIVDLPSTALVDGNLITARFPYDLPRMVQAMVQQLVPEKVEASAAQ